MKTDFKLSVIIPSYNEEKYIEETLKSLKKQSYRNIEVIVVDSSVDDKTRKISERYADKTIYLKERGVGKARNLGAKNASGDIFVFMDADTMIKEGSLEEICRAFKNPDVVCVCGYIEVKSSFLNEMLFMGVSESVWLLSKLNIPLFYGICVSYKREAFEKIKGFDESFITAEDIEISKRASRIGKCILNRKVRALTSARRVEKGGFLKIIVFHIVNLVNFLLSRKTEENYPALR